MFELKPISKDSIPSALAKAEHYRLLNEPRQAESICRDILRADSENQDALGVMLLALTDQFGKAVRVNVNHAKELLARIEDDYRKAYYDGMICERWAKAQLEQGVPGYVAYEWLAQAMELYEQAESLSSAGNDDAILRWNTCARIIKRNEELRPRVEDESQSSDFHDEVPMR